MPKGRRLSSTEQSQIQSVRQAGHSNKAIAEQFGRSRRCIDDFVILRHTVKHMETRAGHRLISRLASNSTMSANQIRARLSLNVSTSTVLRDIRRQVFLRRQRMKPAPRLTLRPEAAKRVSRSTLGWQGDHHVDVLDWPPCSPNLNPIENLWGILVRRVFAGGVQYDCVSSLRAAILSAWNSIPENVTAD